MRNVPALLRQLWHDRAAISVVEFALLSPVLMFSMLIMIELANMATVYTRINQVAIAVADNTSRAKQATGASGAMMREWDVNDAFAGVDLVYPGLKVFNNGRIIVSSLERNADGGQWIHWQRCKGSYTTGVSKYGVEGTGSSGTSFAGMGPAAKIVTADANTAVMFVEVYYRYQPIFFSSGPFGQIAPTLYNAKAMMVRDDRDLSQIYNPSPTATKNSC